MKKVKKARLRLDMTLDDVAKKVGCTSMMISYIERGLRKPSKKLAQRLSKVLNLNPSIFFKERCQ